MTVKPITNSSQSIKFKCLLVKGKIQEAKELAQWEIMGYIAVMLSFGVNTASQKKVNDLFQPLNSENTTCNFVSSGIHRRLQTAAQHLCTFGVR
jgi:hypothetical protein